MNTDKMFEVEVIGRQRVYYQEKAADSELAERRAVERWRRGEPGDSSDLDSGELIAVSAREAPNCTQQQQDDEVILRFIREREQLSTRVGRDSSSGKATDAISAAQVATNLSWLHVDAIGSVRSDIVRASRSLERLCKNRRLVRFERTRNRSGERGRIYLYCTPEYLEQLTAGLEVLQRGTKS